MEEKRQVQDKKWPGQIIVDPNHIPQKRPLSNREILLRIAEKLGVSLE